MSGSSRLRIIVAAVLVVVVVAGGIVAFRHFTAPTRITAMFATTTGIYVGDDVRVSGVKVGTISGIEPRGETVAMTLDVERGVEIPAQAQAIIVAQNLVADRFVQLTPAYVRSGPVMADGATIPRDRTAVPVEWDQVKEQLTRLATDLGPQGDDSSTSLTEFIDSGADALRGNGETLGSALTELSDMGALLAENTGNITDVIRNVGTLVSAVRDSGTQIVQFENRLATLSSVLNGSRSDLDAALKNLAVAVADVQRFIAANRDGASEQVRRLASITRLLVDQDDDLEQLLHAFPTNMANFYNIYNPATGTEAGVFTVNNFSNPIQFICSSVASIENLTAAEGARRCAEYLGPIAPMLTFNYLPVPLNPVLGPDPAPDDVIYTEKSLIPSKSQSTSARSRSQLLLPGLGGGR